LNGKNLTGSDSEGVLLNPAIVAFIRLKWPYFEDMKACMGKRAAVNPPDVFDSGLEIEDGDLDDFAARAGTYQNVDQDEDDNEEAPNDGAGGGNSHSNSESAQEGSRNRYGSLFDMIDEEDDAEDDDAPLLSGGLSLSAGQREAAEAETAASRSRSDNPAVAPETPSTTRQRPGRSKPTPRRGANNNGSALEAIAEGQRIKSQQAAAILQQQNDRDKKWLELEEEKLKKEDIRHQLEAERMAEESRERKRKRDLEDQMVLEESYHRCLRAYTEYRQQYGREKAGRMAFRDKWEESSMYIPE
jgi:hypothetical protein